MKKVGPSRDTSKKTSEVAVQPQQTTIISDIDCSLVILDRSLEAWLGACAKSVRTGNTLAAWQPIASICFTSFCYHCMWIVISASFIAQAGWVNKVGNKFNRAFFGTTLQNEQRSSTSTCWACRSLKLKSWYCFCLWMGLILTCTQTTDRQHTHTNYLKNSSSINIYQYTECMMQMTETYANQWPFNASHCRRLLGLSFAVVHWQLRWVLMLSGCWGYVAPRNFTWTYGGFHTWRYPKMVCL